MIRSRKHPGTPQQNDEWSDESDMTYPKKIELVSLDPDCGLTDEPKFEQLHDQADVDVYTDASNDDAYLMSDDWEEREGDLLFDNDDYDGQPDE